MPGASMNKQQLSECGISDLSDSDCALIIDVFYMKLQISWDFHRQYSLDFIQNGARNKIIQ